MLSLLHVELVKGLCLWELWHSVINATMLCCVDAEVPTTLGSIICNSLLWPRNWRYTGTETRQIFSRMLAISNIFEQLFPITLNGMVVSVWYVFFTQVVPHTGLSNYLRNRKIYLDIYRSGTSTLISNRSLHYAASRINKSIISQRTKTMFVGVVELSYQHHTDVLITECYNSHKHRVIWPRNYRLNRNGDFCKGT